MNKKVFCYLVFTVSILGLLSFSASAAGEADLQILTLKPDATVSVDRVIDDGKAVISVFDQSKNPLFGLSTGDFKVTQSGRTAKVLSVQPISESLDIPRHIVMVMDNSDSMRQRNAIEALLAGIDELLKTVRPIDDVQMIVFSRKAVTMSGRELHVQTLRSSKPAELREFANKAYSDGITSTTVLYEAMLAGLEFIKTMPETEPRFMVIFSDGEDLNSSYKEEEVLDTARTIKGFSAYAIDYMPGPYIDKFLADFAVKNRGQVWKATSEANFVPIFQSVASKMQYYYIINYIFPLTGNIEITPSSLTIDEVRTTGLSGSAAISSKIDTNTLILIPSIDSVYGIVHWKAAITNSNGNVTELMGDGTPSREMRLGLPTQNLQGLSSGGDLTAKLELKDRKGQDLVLTSVPVKVIVRRTSASMTLSPDTLTIDEIKTTDASGSVKVTYRTDTSDIKVRPAVDSAYGIARWRVAADNSKGNVAELIGEGAPAQELKLQIPTQDLQSQASAGDLLVRMELKDNKGQDIVLSPLPVKVNIIKSSAGMTVSPASLTIEEIKTIDSSPMLAHIYFAPGSSEIQSQYVLYKKPDETRGFDEQKFRDTLEKYYQVLNIVGKRLTDHPSATITLVGCNSDTGEEKGKKKLSIERAGAVKDYLEKIWNIASERITVEGRNLPSTPSSSRLNEGQAENRRVEIRSSDPSILAPIRSIYLTAHIDASSLKLHPGIVSPHGIAKWRITVANVGGVVTELKGDGIPSTDVQVPLPVQDLKQLGSGGDLLVSMELQDKKGQNIMLSPLPVKVNFMQSSQRLALKKDLKVQEKYALILFDFDKDTIDARNQEIVDTIAARIKELPDAKAEIMGHTDNIGKESYNVSLSERRAKAVYKMLESAYGAGGADRIHYTGVGPNTPLYDNMSPEARSFNRTVTITLEYLSRE